MVNVLPVHYAWVHPKRPSKAKGRKGTKRTWKSVNPSKFTSVADGPIHQLSISEKMYENILHLVNG